MTKTIVTAVCAVGVVVGGVLLLQLRHAALATSPLPTGSSGRVRAREGVRIACASIAGGMLGGVLLAGMGGRLLMRLIAVTSDERAQGRLTEADEVVGEVTVDGTIFLVVFLGLFAGSVGAALFALARPVLPRRGALAGLVIAGIIGGLLARPSELLDPDSIDFRILGPTWFAALMGVSLIALFGATSGALIDTFTARWPAPSLSPTGLAGLLPLLVLALPSPLTLATIVVMWTRGWERPGVMDRTIGRALAGLLAVGAIAGWLWVVAAAAEIAF